MAEVGKLSASKITTYKGCSLSYFLRYVQHEKNPLNVRLVFGKGVHYMLEKFYKTNYKSSESFSKSWKHYWMSDVAGDFLKGKEKKNLSVNEIKLNDDFTLKIGSHVDLGPEPVGIYFTYTRLGEDILKRFYNRHIVEKDPLNEKRNIPTFVEKSFGVKKDEPFDINGHLVRGVFDRIDETKNGDYITDYKTDKSSPGRDSFTLHRHPQFTIYSYAFRKLWGKEEKAILYYHLRSGNIYKTHRSEKDYDYIKKLLDEVSDGISRDNFVPFYGFHCNMCDLKSACEKYSIPHHGGPRIDLEGKIKGAEPFREWDGEAPDWMEDQVEER